MASGHAMIDRGASRREVSVEGTAVIVREATGPSAAHSDLAVDHHAVARTLGVDRIGRAEEARHVEIATGRERAQRTSPPGRWVDRSHCRRDV